MNNLGTNSGDGKISFLTQGTYLILSITSERNSFGSDDFPAKVRRFSNGIWIDENVNLAFLFRNGSKGPLHGFQRNKLVDQTIRITNMVPQTSRYGRTCYAYHWEITEVIIDPQTDFINAVNAKIALIRQGAKIESQEDSELLDCEENLTDFLSDLNKQFALKRQGN